MKSKLIETRKSFNLTQQQVAEYLNISRSAYCNYERGIREIPLIVAVKLKTLFKVKDDTIFLNSNDTNRDINQSA